MNGTMETTRRLSEYDNPRSYLVQEHGVETHGDYRKRKEYLQRRLADINDALVDLVTAYNKIGRS